MQYSSENAYFSKYLGKHVISRHTAVCVQPRLMAVLCLYKTLFSSQLWKLVTEINDVIQQANGNRQWSLAVLSMGSHVEQYRCI